MTTSNKHNTEQIGGSAYDRSPQDMTEMLSELISRPEYRFIDKDSNPDIENIAIYRVDSTDNLADIGRTIETRVFSDDAGYTKQFLKEVFEPYDNNSFFYISIDHEDPVSPKIVGVMRIIECEKGPSETVSMFREFYENEDLPDTLKAVENRERIWDVLSIALEPEYRNGINSLWLYHSLYKDSVDRGVQNWVSNITPREIRNLKEYIGIPFEEIEGAPPVSETLPNGEEAIYGFYKIDVGSIEPAVTAHIDRLRNESETSKKENASLLAKIASLALYGR